MVNLVIIQRIANKMFPIHEATGLMRKLTRSFKDPEFQSLTNLRENDSYLRFEARTQNGTYVSFQRKNNSTIDYLVFRKKDSETHYQGRVVPMIPFQKVEDIDDINIILMYLDRFGKRKIDNIIYKRAVEKGRNRYDKEWGYYNKGKYYSFSQKDIKRLRSLVPGFMITVQKNANSFFDSISQDINEQKAYQSDINPGYFRKPFNFDLEENNCKLNLCTSGNFVDYDWENLTPHEVKMSIEKRAKEISRIKLVEDILPKILSAGHDITELLQDYDRQNSTGEVAINPQISIPIKGEVAR
jgi:hypothetical protein